VRVLLDTHVLLWMVADSPRLSSVSRRMAGDPAVTKLVSIASLWEIAVKVRLKKLELGMEFGAFTELIGGQRLAELLPVTPAHVKRLADMDDMHHRDPFDRMLVAQALAENLALVSADTSLDAYGIRRLS